MRVLVDTSVWSLALRRKESSVNKETEILRGLIEQGEDIYLIGIILQEILQGIKRHEDFQSLKKYFDAFPLLELTREDYVKAAALKNSLIKKGIQGGTIDALIAWACIGYNCVLFTADKDFQQIARHSKLKVMESEVS